MVGSAVADVAVCGSAASGEPSGFSRTRRRDVRALAWIRDVSSTQSTTAASSGSDLRPARRCGRASVSMRSRRSRRELDRSAPVVPLHARRLSDAAEPQTATSATSPPTIYARRPMRRILRAAAGRDDACDDHAAEFRLLPQPDRCAPCPPAARRAPVKPARREPHSPTCRPSRRHSASSSAIRASRCTSRLPTAAWLNLDERWFAELPDELFRRSAHRSRTSALLVASSTHLLIRLNHNRLAIRLSLSADGSSRASQRLLPANSPTQVTRRRRPEPRPLARRSPPPPRGPRALSCRRARGARRRRGAAGA